MPYDILNCFANREPGGDSKCVTLTLPDGRILQATAVDDDNFPAVNVSVWDFGKEKQVCFVEYNPERDNGPELCVGIYANGSEETKYYEAY